MNLNICKKCNKKCFIAFYKYSENVTFFNTKMQTLKINDYHNIIDKSEKVLLHNNNKDWICYRKDGSYRVCNKYDFICIGVSKKCPYYIEHFMNDINEIG